MLHWVTGYPDRSLRELREALRLAEDLKHPLTTVIAYWFAAWVHYQRGERELAFSDCERLIDLAKPHGFSRWIGDVETVHRLARAAHLDHDMLAECGRQFASVPAASWRQVFCRCSVAELCAQQGFAAEGMQLLFSIPESNRSFFSGPEIHRIEGELLLKREQPAHVEAERCFNAAIMRARASGEKSFELRAAISLARLLAARGRRDDAREALASIYGWFTEGFGTADLKAAQALLQELDAA
jgi:hypothetical protein